MEIKREGISTVNKNEIYLIQILSEKKYLLSLNYNGIKGSLRLGKEGYIPGTDYRYG